MHIDLKTEWCLMVASYLSGAIPVTENMRTAKAAIVIYCVCADLLKINMKGMVHMLTP